MKKQIRPGNRSLRLDREVVVHLTPGDLVRVAGGSKNSACSCDTTSIPGLIPGLIPGPLAGPAVE